MLQTERRRPKINTVADRAAFGHRAWLLDLYCLCFRDLCVCMWVRVPSCCLNGCAPDQKFARGGALTAVERRLSRLRQWDSRSSDCGRRIFSLQLERAHIICYGAALLSVPLPYLLPKPSPSLSPKPVSRWRLSFIKWSHLWSVSSLWWMDEWSDVRRVNDWNKQESWARIRKSPAPSYCCLIFIQHQGWGQNVKVVDFLLVKFISFFFFIF